MEKPLPDAPNQIDDFFVLAGLNKSIAVAWSLRMNGTAFESRTAIFSKGEREGLLGTLDEEPLTAGSIKSIPQGTPFAVAFRLRQPKILPFVRQAVKALQGPKGLEHFDEVERQLSAEMGRDLDKELQAALGGEVALSSVAGSELVSPLSALSAATMSLSVKDAAKADELLGQLLTRYAKSAGQGAEVKETEFDGVKIRYLPGRKMAGVVDISPAFAIADSHLLIALDVPALKKSMNILKNGPSLADGEIFKTNLNAVGGKLGPMFSYVDWAFAVQCRRRGTEAGRADRSAQGYRRRFEPAAGDLDDLAAPVPRPVGGADHAQRDRADQPQPAAFDRGALPADRRGVGRVQHVQAVPGDSAGEGRESREAGAARGEVMLVRCVFRVACLRGTAISLLQHS
jgi:hypothetical protein